MNCVRIVWWRLASTAREEYKKISLTLLAKGHKKASKLACATDEFDPNGSALLLTCDLPGHGSSSAST
jgi:hypothetical protein